MAWCKGKGWDGLKFSRGNRITATAPLLNLNLNYEKLQCKNSNSIYIRKGFSEKISKFYRNYVDFDIKITIYALLVNI